MDHAYATGIVFLLLVAVVVLAAVAMLAYVVYYYLLAGLLAPTRRVMAKVVRKQHRMKMISGGVPRANAYTILTGEFEDDDGISCDCFVTFEFDGRQQEFAVPMMVYTDLEEGDVGLLEHKGNLFRKFMKGAVGWSDPVKAQITPVKS